MYETILHLYVENCEMPLPSLEEVLICKPDTTTEEVMIVYLFVYKLVKTV